MSMATIKNRLLKANKQTLPTWAELSAVIATIAGEPNLEQTAAITRMSEDRELPGDTETYDAWYMPHLSSIKATWDKQYPRWRETIEMWKRGIDL